MSTMKTITQMNEIELENGIVNGSWHEQYKDSAYIYVGGLNFELTEGDISIVFSQYGEIVDVRIVRDQTTGKSKGFAFIAYEDQRSTVLAVDNLNGIELVKRRIKVDHVSKYKLPKEYTKPDSNKEYKPSGPDGKGWGSFRDFTEDELEAFKAHEEKLQARKVAAEGQYNEIQEAKKKMVVDEDERWERKLLEDEEKEDEMDLFEKVRMEAKKIKKEKKKSKKNKKDKMKKKKGKHT